LRDLRRATNKRRFLTAISSPTDKWIPTSFNGACAKAGSENAVTNPAKSKVVGRILAPPRVAPNLDLAAAGEIFSDQSLCGKILKTLNNPQD
jgi:hypothetical protein